MVDRCQVLASLRVLDLGDADTDGVGRLLADLGADVLKIEPPGGTPDRAAPPSVGGASIGFALHNANKRAAVLDATVEQDRARLLELVSEARHPDRRRCAHGRRSVRHHVRRTRRSVRPPRRACPSVTSAPQGRVRTGRRPTRCSTRCRPPCLARVRPPGAPCFRRSASHRRPPRYRPPGPRSSRTITGCVVARETTSTSRDSRRSCKRWIHRSARRDRPRSDRNGPANCGVAAHETNRSTRPSLAATASYESVCCRPANGGACGPGSASPTQFADPKFETIAARYAVSRELNAAIAQLFGPQTWTRSSPKDSAVACPSRPCSRLREALASEHFRSVGALTDFELAPGIRLSVPTGPIVVDGRHTGIARARSASRGGRAVVASVRTTGWRRGQRTRRTAV